MRNNNDKRGPGGVLRPLLCHFLMLAMAWSLFPAGALADQRDDIAGIPLIGEESIKAVDGLKGGEDTEDADASKDADGDKAVSLGDDSDEEEVQLLAQWTAHSRSEALAWVNSQNGKALDFDGSYGPQCVDFTCFYYQYLGQAIPWGNANQYANGGNFCPAGWSYQGSPQPGDIAVWTSKAYDPSVGHVGIVTEVNGSQMVCMEQNSDGWGAPCRPISHSIYAANTYIRPDWPSENRDPTGAFDECHGGPGTIRVRGWAYDDDSYNTPVRLHVYVGDSCYTNDVAGKPLVSNMDRPDLGKACGFDYTIEVAERGNQAVRVYAINNEQGNNPLLGGGSKMAMINGVIMDRPYVDISPGDFVIRSAIGGRVLDIDGSRIGENGANAQIWEFNGSGNQIFHVVRNGNGYRINPKLSDKVLEVSGNADVATLGNVQQWQDNNDTDQRWLFQDAGDGWVYVRNLNGYYLDVEGGWSSNCNGGNVQTWEENGTEAQKWKLERVVRSLSEAAVSVTKSFVYTGSRLTPTPTVKFGGAALVKGTDYDVSYKNNVNVGTATVTVTGKGDYTGTKSATFKIAIPFADVTMKTGHAGDIGWLYEVKVSQGWALPSGDREYRPLISVARADMAAFLFRLATRWNLAKESWKPTGESSFSDVDASTAHYREIMWLAEQGISVGWNNADGTKSFRPYANVARADMAAFLARLYRLRGRATTGSKGFLDVDDGTAHSEDIRWLAARGVSKGWDVTGGSEFRPYANVARADMAAFLHRLDGLK